MGGGIVKKRGRKSSVQISGIKSEPNLASKSDSGTWAVVESSETGTGDPEKDEKVHKLQLTIISAQNLKKVSWFRRPEPYAVAWVDIRSQKHRTHSDRVGGRNPTWNTIFNFEVDRSFLEKDTAVLTIELYNRGLLWDSLVGTVRILLQNLVKDSQRVYSKGKCLTFMVMRPSGRRYGILNIGVLNGPYHLINSVKEDPSSVRLFLDRPNVVLDRPNVVGSHVKMSELGLSFEAHAIPFNQYPKVPNSGVPIPNSGFDTDTTTDVDLESAYASSDESSSLHAESRVAFVPNGNSGTSSESSIESGIGTDETNPISPASTTDTSNTSDSVSIVDNSPLWEDKTT